MRIPFELPAGWPWSIWFFVITLAVYLLQRFPLTGIFLMVVGAAYWSVLLINLGMLGIIWESLTLRVSLAWLAIPALYFGGYYAAYFHDRASLALVQAETARFNAGKSLPFDGAARDLVVRSGDARWPTIFPSTLVERYDVARAYDGDKRVYTIGTSKVCTLINSDRAFLSAGIQGYMLSVPQGEGRRRPTDFCRVMMPGQPEKPVFELLLHRRKKRVGLLETDVGEFNATDTVTGKTATVRSGIATPFKPFPMPAMGCFLNSGAPSWDCFHGFLRDRIQIVAGAEEYSSGEEVVAHLLGLTRTDDHSATALGTEPFEKIAERIKAEKVAKEIAILERMLADPEAYIENGWLWHLPDRPEVVAPYAARIFDALERLQSREKETSDTGKNLARLVAEMSPDTLAPFHARLIRLLAPATAREWITDTYMLYTRLDVADPTQRAYVLDRLDLEKRSFPAELLPPFCRMGAAAPDDAKQRLLALWRKRTPDPTNKGWGTERDRIDAVLYLTLARMGLKQQAGRVDQRFYREDFLDIWSHITPSSPADVCTGNPDEIRAYFRKAGFRA